MDPFCRNLELANQAEHEDDLPENLSEITDLWNSPARTHVSTNIPIVYVSVQLTQSIGHTLLHTSFTVLLTGHIRSRASSEA